MLSKVILLKGIDLQRQEGNCNTRFSWRHHLLEVYPEDTLQENSLMTSSSKGRGISMKEEATVSLTHSLSWKASLINWQFPLISSFPSLDFFFLHYLWNINRMWRKEREWRDCENTGSKQRKCSNEVEGESDTILLTFFSCWCQWRYLRHLTQ